MFLGASIVTLVRHCCVALRSSFVLLLSWPSFSSSHFILNIIPATIPLQKLLFQEWNGGANVGCRSLFSRG